MVNMSSRKRHVLQFNAHQPSEAAGLIDRVPALGGRWMNDGMAGLCLSHVWSHTTPLPHTVPQSSALRCLTYERYRLEYCT